MTRRSRVLLGVCCIYCCVTEVKGEVDGLVTGDCSTFATLKCIVNHIRVVTFTNQNPWNGLHAAKILQSPVTSPIPRVLIGGRDPPVCFYLLQGFHNLLYSHAREACSCVDKLISNSSLSSPRLISNYSIAKGFVPMINFSQDCYKQLTETFRSKGPLIIDNAVTPVSCSE